MSERTATIQRQTNETDISLRLALDEAYSASETIDTGIAFFDHMLTQIARHGNFTLSIKAVGDLAIDGHHTVEDVGIVLGKAFDIALGNKQGIRRYGHARIPLDEALADVVIDCSGRPYLFFDAAFTNPKLGDFDTELVEEFFRAFAVQARMTIHAEIARGQNSHHMAEALFKALARSLREAVGIDPTTDDIPSSKGLL